MTELRTLMTDIAFGESPRWHDDRLWFADWGAQEVVALDLDGASEVMVRVSFPSFPMSIDWLPDGRLLIVSARDGMLLRREPVGSLVTHADLSVLAEKGHPWNEIVVDGRGNAYINNQGFDFPGGEFAPGTVALLTPDGAARQVADGIAFPNGMAVTPDNSTLICAESYGKRLTAYDIAADGGLSNRRVWAHLGDGVPDGICIDADGAVWDADGPHKRGARVSERGQGLQADGAVWYADVPNKRCARVSEGGQVLQAIEVDRGCFACALGGADDRTLFIVAQEWSGPANMRDAARTGRLLIAQAPAPGAGWP